LGHERQVQPRTRSPTIGKDPRHDLSSFARSARIGILAALAPAGLAAQTFARASNPGAAAAEGAVVRVQSTPGATYRAGRVHRMVLGTGYRAQWRTSVPVEVLELARFGGGLAPTRTGGDFSTRSLRFKGGDGREYVFRSVDKDATQGLHPHLKNTLVDRVVQDQVSSALPGAVLVASALQTAAGVLHAPPRLVVMPDDAALGEFRGDFGGCWGRSRSARAPGAAPPSPAARRWRGRTRCWRRSQAAMHTGWTPEPTSKPAFWTW
jgi:hypothetical protein